MTQPTSGQNVFAISEGGFRTLFNNLPIPCFGYDTEGKILIWNRSFVDLYRFSVTDILQHSLTKNVVDPEERRKRRITMKGVFAGKSFFGQEWQVKRADGYRLILRVDTFPFKEADNRVIMGIATCIDITAQRRNEEALLGAAQQWRDTFDAMADSVSIIDTEGRILRTNMATVRMTGRSLQEILESSCNDLFHKGVDPPEECPSRQMVQSRRSEHREFHFPGENRWISETVSPILEDDDTINGAVLVISDISEQKNTERALTVERDKAQQYLDIAEVILVALDSAGKVILINRKGCKILGYEEQELLGRDWFDSCIPSHCQDHTRDIFQKIREGECDQYESCENPVLTRSGDERTIAWRNTVLRDENGDIIGSLSSGEDITDQERLKAQLLQSEKMSALGLLISGVAHELNNPMTGVLGYSQLLLGHPNLPPSVTSAIERISQEAERARKIVNNLLTFARKRKPEKTLVRLNDVVERTLELRDYEMRVNNISLMKRFDSEIPLVHADESQLQQVFLNLMINAEQAMLGVKKTGRLEVATRWDPAAQVVHITFQDDGPGISREHRSKIFDPFFTTKGEGTGTGLGLSISYGIISEHGGKITVDSEMGQGATFRIELPCSGTKKKGSAGHPAGESPEQTSPKKILVIDDETSIVELVKITLEKIGYRVETATDGDSAISAITAHSFDAVITDIKMPGRNGLDVLNFCREKKPDLFDRMLVFTGALVDSQLIRTLEEECVPCIMKPFNAEELMAAVSRLFEDSS